MENICLSHKCVPSFLGDRRIRIHTLCLPVTKDLTSVFKNFDLRCSASLLTKMGLLLSFFLLILFFLFVYDFFCF